MVKGGGIPLCSGARQTGGSQYKVVHPPANQKVESGAESEVLGGNQGEQEAGGALKQGGHRPVYSEAEQACETVFDRDEGACVGLQMVQMSWDSQQKGPRQRMSTGALDGLLHTGSGHLVLNGILVGEKELEAIAASGAAIRRLELMNNGICGSTVGALADLIKASSSLEELNLSSNEIRQRGLRGLATVFRLNSVITRLDMTDCGLSNTNALAPVLDTNTTLAELILAQNGIESVSAISDALKRNPALRTLNLRGNFIEDDGATALAACLKVNRGLRTLDLEAK